MTKQIDFSDTVLVVDDEPFILRTTAAALSSLGYTHVETANNVADALKLISTTQPTIDLVICDLNMPGVDGLELLKRFDEMAYRGDILIISGEDTQTLKMAESLAHARGLSVIGSIAKPIQAEALSNILSQLSLHERNTKKPAAEGMAITPVMLESAIEAGELKPWFQPKIDIANRKPVGVEVLARWPESSIGPIFPDTFIPIAEAHGLIDRLTFSLIEQAIKIDQGWREQDIDMEMAVNISMNSLYDEEFPDKLEQHVMKACGSIDQIKLEVTETQLMEDLVRPLEALLRLRMKKVKLSIDDFGTGHSNISQLRNLPFDELKLDRSYVHSSVNEERTDLILESTVEMAKKLDMSIVAEGVETLEDWIRVEQLGCDIVQGYFSARPMPGDEIPDWIASWPRLRDGLFGG